MTEPLERHPPPVAEPSHLPLASRSKCCIPDVGIMGMNEMAGFSFQGQLDVLSQNFRTMSGL
jgi:hypothetical protein